MSGTPAVLSAAASQRPADGVEGVGVYLRDAILCVFVPNGAHAEFYREKASAHDRMHCAAMEIVPSGDPNRDFALSMILHHQGAIDMAELQIRHGSNQRLRRLAQAIIVEQRQEIEAMRIALREMDGSSAEHPRNPVEVAQ